MTEYYFDMETTGLNPSTDKIITIHPHVLRKFFRSKLSQVIPVDVTEALMGHEGYLTEVYRRYSPEDLAKSYLKGESTLLVFTEAEEVGKLRAEIDEKNKQLQTLVNGLSVENMELKGKVNGLDSETKKLGEELHALKDWKKKLDDFVEIVDTIKDKEGTEDLTEYLERRRREREAKDQAT